MPNPFDFFLETANPSIVSRVDIPPRAERRAPPPSKFGRGKTGQWLAQMVGGADTVWSHQALALGYITDGRDVVISTATASGKSLIFQTAIIDALLSNDQSTHIVLYPQKALGGDQLGRWQTALERAGLNQNLVCEINGDIPPSDRDALLATSAIILVTPDVVHSWFMRCVNVPTVQSFLAHLQFVVIDEAHSCEGVFGSNSAFLYRRLCVAASRAKDRASRPAKLQFIAATATIADPVGHLQSLTGRSFAAVTEADNGAAYHGLTLLHIEGPEHGAPAEKMLTDTISSLASKIAPHAAVVFMDSRQGAERVTRAIGRDDVWPHRSGYERSDRLTIEQRLRVGDLRAVVATSTLELGIDIPQFTIGLTLGVPKTRKAAHQRAGRIGRSCAGVFAVVAPGPAFAKFGSSLKEFFSSEVEPSNLYLENRFIQFQQARCLLEEIAPGPDGFALPDEVEWPAGFAEMFRFAQPGAIRPRDLEHVVCGSGGPHLSFALRRISSVSYALKRRGCGNKIGTIDHEKALREAHPGATYHHCRKTYRVVEWRSASWEHSIILEEVKAGAPTTPMLRTLVSTSTEHDGVIEDRIMQSSAGTFAEVRLGVSESVEGYAIGSTKIHYREARLTNERMTRQQREFSSTGILIRIDAPWFKGDGDAAMAARYKLAGALVELLSRERSIAPGDIRFAHSGIAVVSSAGPSKIDDGIVVFDSAQGGLRLSASIFDEFPDLLDRLAKGVELAGADALISAALVDNLRDWYAELEHPNECAPPSPLGENDEMIVFAPGSEVGVRMRGALLHRTVHEAQLLSFGDEDKLMYRYEPKPGATGWVAHENVEPIGHNWRHMAWNPFSNELRELAA